MAFEYRYRTIGDALREAQRLEDNSEFLFDLPPWTKRVENEDEAAFLELLANPRPEQIRFYIVHDKAGPRDKPQVFAFMATGNTFGYSYTPYKDGPHLPLIGARQLRLDTIRGHVVEDYDFTFTMPPSMRERIRDGLVFFEPREEQWLPLAAISARLEKLSASDLSKHVVTLADVLAHTEAHDLVRERATEITPIPDPDYVEAFSNEIEVYFSAGIPDMYLPLKFKRRLVEGGVTKYLFQFYNRRFLTKAIVIDEAALDKLIRSRKVSVTTGLFHALSREVMRLSML